MGAWYIRVTGKRRKDVDINLLVQAILALGEQMRDEERRAQGANQEEPPEPESGTEAPS